MIDPDDQHKANRERASKDVKKALQKSNEDLLKEIFFVSDDRLFHDNTTRTNRLLAHFSSLLVNLSRQAEKSTKKIIILTYVLVVFTIALLFVGIMQNRIMNKQETQFKIQRKQTQENNSKPQAEIKPIPSTKPDLPPSFVPIIIRVSQLPFPLQVS
jgi:hypothetical protein